MSASSSIHDEHHLGYGGGKKNSSHCHFDVQLEDIIMTVCAVNLFWHGLIKVDATSVSSVIVYYVICLNQR